MPEPIDKQKVQTEIALIAKHLARSDAQKAIIGRILFMIDNLPTIEPEVRHGRWEIINTDANVWKCTTCGDEWMLNDGNPSDNNMLFCPHCGSRMCGGEQE